MDENKTQQNSRPHRSGHSARPLRYNQTTEPTPQSYLVHNTFSSRGRRAIQACRSRLLTGSMFFLRGLRSPAPSMTFGHPRRSPNLATSRCQGLRRGLLPTRTSAYQRPGKCHDRPCHGTVQKHRFEVEPWHLHELFDGAMSSHSNN